MSDLKIVIVGAGFATRIVHMPGYSGIGVPVAAICDLDRARAQSMAGQYVIPSVYTDWREMLEKELPNVDGTALEATDSSGSNPGVIAGVTAAIAAGVASLGGAAWYVRRRRTP